MAASSVVNPLRLVAVLAKENGRSSSFRIAPFLDKAIVAVIDPRRIVVLRGAIGRGIVTVNAEVFSLTDSLSAQAGRT